MKVIVTGAAGFLGSHVADALSNAGHEVVVFDNRPSPHLRGDQIGVVGSILDPAALCEAAKGCEVIYHFAAIADISKAMASPVDAVEVNVLGTVKALEVARQLKLRRFVMASTIYVYSNQGSFYRTSKLACERLIEDYYERFGLPFTILRFGSLYGPRADSSNSIYRMIKQALREGCVEFRGDGAEIREYIHVLDGAASAVQILDSEFENAIMHLTGHERMTTSELVQMINEIMNKKLEIKFNPFSGNPAHYSQTPYNYMPRLGRKLLRPTFIDLGLGLVDLMHQLDSETLGPKEAG